MKIYITTHGDYEDNQVTLCTIDFDLAIKHFIDFSRSRGNIQVWENNEAIYEYGNLKHHVINHNEEITYDELKEDFMKYFK